MLEAAMFPQKYDGRSLPPEVNQGCGEGRRGGGLRVHTEEAPWVGGGLAWLHLAQRGERRGGVWRVLCFINVLYQVILNAISTLILHVSQYFHTSYER